MKELINCTKNLWEERYIKIKYNTKKSRIKKKLYFIAKLIIIIIVLLLLFKKKDIKFIESKGKLKFILKKKLQITKKDTINYYLSHISPKYDEYKNREKKFIEKFFSLKIFSPEKNSPINEKIKQELLNTINKLFKKNLTKLNIIYINDDIEFGNTMISINNILYYCEILGCNNIYLNPRINWYIKNEIVTEIFNISLNSNVNCKDSTTLCVSLSHKNFWFYIITVRPEIRINILKNEMKRNLPQLKIDKDDLYIHIRVNKLNVNYGQPPLCFYETIINNFKFKNIYLISGIKSSSLIEKLLNEYPNIIFRINSKEVDISYLANAYNLVGSISSFFEVSVKMNDNLKKLFEYDISKSINKIEFLHYDFYYVKRKYTIYKMIPSINYRNKMYVFKLSKEQDQYMIEEKCTNNLEIIKPNI